MSHKSSNLKFYTATPEEQSKFPEPEIHRVPRGGKNLLSTNHNRTHKSKHDSMQLQNSPHVAKILNIFESYSVNPNKILDFDDTNSIRSECVVEHITETVTETIRVTPARHSGSFGKKTPNNYKKKKNSEKKNFLGKNR